MKLKNHYFLLRHGQTIYQTEKRDILYPFPEDPPIPITREGERQVKESAEKLKAKNIDLIFSSDFFRTRQTAGIVSRALGVEVNFDKRLQDLNLGEFRGRLMKDYQDFFSEKKERFFKRPKAGETWNDLKKRLTDFLEEVEKKYRGKNILIISHGDPLWLLVGILKGFTEEEEFLASRNTELYPNVGQFLEIK